MRVFVFALGTVGIFGSHLFLFHSHPYIGAAVDVASVVLLANNRRFKKKETHV